MCPFLFLNAHSPCKSYLPISKTKPKSKIPPKPTMLSVLYCQGPECHCSTVELCNYYIYYVHKVYYLLSVSSTIPGRPYLPKAPQEQWPWDILLSWWVALWGWVYSWLTVEPSSLLLSANRFRHTCFLLRFLFPASFHSLPLLNHEICLVPSKQKQRFNSLTLLLLIPGSPSRTASAK